MKTKLTWIVAAAAALTLAACKDSPRGTAPASGNAPASAPAVPVAVETIAEQAKGFSVGPAMSARVVYVFFDPQCPHCAALWTAAKPLRNQARFVWIPVSLLNANSTLQGATLLAATDPVTAMDGHEASLLDKRGGIPAASNIDPQKDIVARNTELFNRMGFSSVPTIVGKHAQTGEVVKREGSLPTEALANLLGLPS